MGEIRKDGVGYPVLFLCVWLSAVTSGAAGAYVGISWPGDTQPPAHSREFARTGVDITCGPSPMGKPTIPMWDRYPEFSEFAQQRNAGPGGIAVATCTDGKGQSAAERITFFPLSERAQGADFVLPGSIDNYTITAQPVSAPAGQGDQLKYVTSADVDGLAAQIAGDSQAIIHQQPTTTEVIANAHRSRVESEQGATLQPCRQSPVPNMKICG